MTVSSFQRSPAMRRRLLSVSVLAGILLVLPSGCGMFKSVPDTIDVQDPMPSTAVVGTAWRSGNGFLVARDDRLLLTSQRVANVTAEKDIDVVFPLLEDGKLVPGLAAFKSKGKHVKVKKILVNDARHDLAILQLESV